jgi:outer membrane protein assembly factor BamB
LNATLALLVALGLTTCLAAAPADWPCFRGPNHDGTFAERLALVSGEPEVLWRAKVGKGNCSFAIVGGRLYTAAEGATDSVICLDARTGQKVWSVSHFHAVGEATPTVAGERLFLPYWGKSGPAATAVATADGKVLWQTPLPKSSGVNHYGPAGSARVWEDLVFFNIAGGAAMKKDSGEVVWAHEGHTAYATPVMFAAKGKPAVAFFTGDSLIARDTRSGRELWKIPWKTSLHVSACDPLFLGDRVFLCSAYGRGRALYDVSGASPRSLWEEHSDGSGNSYSSGFAHGDGVFFFTGNGFASLEVTTGKLRWEYPGWGRAILIGDTLIWLSHRGELATGPLDPARKFEPVLRAQVIGGTTQNVPAYWDGKLYVRNEAGDVVCLRIAK